VPTLVLHPSPDRILPIEATGARTHEPSRTPGTSS
jgi:hypothetical protein